MSMVRLLGFETLECGCTSGTYREISADRTVTYIEKKGAECTLHAHRTNHTLHPARVAVRITPLAARA
jgi:hypothetical protein